MKVCVSRKAPMVVVVRTYAATKSIYSVSESRSTTVHDYVFSFWGWIVWIWAEFMRYVLNDSEGADAIYEAQVQEREFDVYSKTTLTKEEIHSFFDLDRIEDKID